LALIAIAHLPFACLLYIRLWSLEHYQFFPFAFGAFAWLFLTRRVKGSFRWDEFSTTMLVVDVVFLAAGIYLTSPWLVCVGAFFLCLAICRSFTDSESDRSLAYLALLPLLTIRPPLQWDLDVIHWLQTKTTQVASQLLNHFGFLHLREGNILEFSGKRFLVEEACSGVQSLFTLLFLASLIVCGYRRTWLHSGLVLLSAGGLAGLLNVIRVASISMAWFSYEVDLSTGWQHDTIGYVALVVAALLVFSTDALMNFLLSPVPDFPRAGVASRFYNPFTAIWNWLFLVMPRISFVTKETTADGLFSHRVQVAVAGCVCIGALVAQWQVF